MKKAIILLLFIASLHAQIVPIHKNNFTIYFNTETKLPAYAKEVLKTQNFTKIYTRKQIKRDNEISITNQAKNKDYLRDTIYDKGHLVPIINVNYSANTISDANRYTNIAPQHYMLNRGVWRDLENYIKNLYVLNNYPITIYTGLDNGYRKIGTLKIPLRFWKLIFVNGNWLAWQFENKNTINFNFNSYAIDPFIIKAKIANYGLEQF